MAQRNYVLGKGDVYFARFLPVAGMVVAETPGPYRFVGNTPEINITTETETLDHVNSDEGVNQVDASVPLSITRSGTLVMDDIQRENLALFFLGSVRNVAGGVIASTTETFAGAKRDDTYQIGRTAARRSGLRGLDITAATIGGNAAMENRDVAFDGANGLVTILDTVDASVLAAGATGDLVVTYERAANEGAYQEVISGSTPVEGAMLFVEDNPKGENNEWVFPKVSVRPNGDLALKGDTWRSIPFTLSVLQPSSGEAMYVNGVPA